MTKRRVPLKNLDEETTLSDVQQVGRARCILFSRPVSNMLLCQVLVVEPRTISNIYLYQDSTW